MLGSKPGALWSDADEIYCANGAIGFYSQKLTNAKSVVNVVSARILNKSKRLHESHSSEFYSSKLTAISDANPSRMILISSIAQPTLAMEMSVWLKSNGYKSCIEILDHDSRIQIQEQLTDQPYPVPLRTIFQGSIPIAIYDFIHLLLYRLRLKNGEVNRKYRPSTGIIALLIAIQEHGDNAEYCIAGVGLSKRNVHIINGQLKSVPSKRDNAGNEPHVLADKVIISSLARKYHLISYESSIAKLIKNSQNSCN